MEVKLIRNDGFKWFNKNETYTKGYIHINGNTYQGEGMSDFFSKLNFNSDDIENKLREINGCFSAIVNQNEKTYLIVDRMASFPLYFSQKQNIVSDSVDGIISEENKESLDIDDRAIEEILYSNYATGNKTTIKEIEVVNLGQYWEIGTDVKKVYYYRHLHNETIKNDLLDKYKEKNDIIFDNLIRSLNGRKAVIPLSGGYDSRYIAAMLKKKNYTNVICYTYGNENSYEVKNSRRVAEELGFPWYFVPYTKTKWKELIETELQSYCEYAHNYYCAPNVQDLIAVKFLVDNNIINKECIIVNGFCGDLPAGSFVLKEKIENNKALAEYIYAQNYHHMKPNINVKNDILQEINQHLNQIDSTATKYEEINNLSEEWFTSARPCKWVVNSNRTYEYFGMEWRMPLWDNEFIDFFYNIGVDQRRNCKFYREFLFKELFEPMNIAMKKPEKTFKEVNELKRKAKRILLKIINYMRIISGINFININPINEYDEFTVLLSKDVKNKNIINYQYINPHQMMAIWWSEKKYGEKNILKIMKRGKTK